MVKFHKKHGKDTTLTSVYPSRRFGALNELNIDLKSTPKFIGVFEHFYDDSMYKNVSTHYVNIAYEYEMEETPDLPTEQHSEYKWFTINELLESKQVHKYVKNYFRN